MCPGFNPQLCVCSVIKAPCLLFDPRCPYLSANTRISPNKAPKKEKKNMHPSASGCAILQTSTWVISGADAASSYLVRSIKARHNKRSGIFPKTDLHVFTRADAFIWNHVQGSVRVGGGGGELISFSSTSRIKKSHVHTRRWSNLFLLICQSKIYWSRTESYTIEPAVRRL